MCILLLPKHGLPLISLKRSLQQRYHKNSFLYFKTIHVMRNQCFLLMSDSVSVNYGFWIGLRDRKDQTFRWADDNDVTYVKWQSSEPQGFTPYKQGCTYISFYVSCIPFIYIEYLTFQTS